MSTSDRSNKRKSPRAPPAGTPVESTTRGAGVEEKRYSSWGSKVRTSFSATPAALPPLCALLCVWDAYVKYRQWKAEGRAVDHRSATTDRHSERPTPCEPPPPPTHTHTYRKSIIVVPCTATAVVQLSHSCQGCMQVRRNTWWRRGSGGERRRWLVCTGSMWYRRSGKVRTESRCGIAGSTLLQTPPKLLRCSCPWHRTLSFVVWKEN